jgi:hypothetical protein
MKAVKDIDINPIGFMRFLEDHLHEDAIDTIKLFQTLPVWVKEASEATYEGRLAIIPATYTKSGQPLTYCLKDYDWCNVSYKD